jgi:hypothetical protein
MGIGGNSSGVEKHDKKKKHDSEQETGPLIKPLEDDADCGRDEGRTDQIGEE